MIHEWTWVIEDVQGDMTKDVNAHMQEMEKAGWTPAFMTSIGQKDQYIRVHYKRCAYCKGKGTVPCDVGDCACPNNCKGLY